MPTLNYTSSSSAQSSSSFQTKRYSGIHVFISFFRREVLVSLRYSVQFIYKYSTDMAEHNDAPLCGGVSAELQGADLEQAVELLNSSLAKVAATGDKPSFKVVKVKSVTSQVVAGRLYHYKLQLAQGDDIKESYVKIWTQPWLPENSINITIKCEGDDNVIESTF